MITEQQKKVMAGRGTGGQRQPEKKPSHWVGYLVGGLLMVGVGVGGYFGYQWYEAKMAAAGAAGKSADANRPVVVVTAVAVKGDMPIYLSALGTVTSYNTVTLRTRIDGQLNLVNFKEGDVVVKDQLLFEIDPRPYTVQLQQAEAQLAKDQSSLDNANRDLKRYTEAGDAVPQQTRDTAAATVSQLQATIKGDQTQINSANLNLTYCEIRAPITGTIGFRMVDQGNMVHASDQNGLAVITQLQPISAVFSLRQDDLPRVLKAKAAGPVRAEAWDRDLKKMLTVGVVESVDNQIDATTATVRIKATYENKDLLLYPNQFVNVKLLVETLHDVVMVNPAALQQSPDGTFVYLVKQAPATQPAAAMESQGGKAPTEAGPAATGPATRRAELVVERREVKTGASEDNFTVVTEGLNAGDVVVVDGVDKLVEGKRVTTGPGAGATQPAGAATRSGRNGRRGAETAPATRPEMGG